MRTRHLDLALLAALLLVPGLAAARAAPTPDQIRRNPELLAQYLQLSASQATTEQQLFQTLRSTVQPIHQQQGLKTQLLQLLEGPSPDPCAAGGLLLQIGANHDLVQAAFLTFDTAFAAILTPTQLARYDALKTLAHFGDDSWLF